MSQIIENSQNSQNSQSEHRECVVFVTNKKYLSQFEKSLNQLRENGKYSDKILLVIGDDLVHNNDELEEKYKITVKFFPDIQFSENFMEHFKSLDRGNLPHFQQKIFQYHKFYLFHSYFKENFEKIIYIDCGMHTNSNVKKLFDLGVSKTLLADYDFRVHPKRFHKTLECQFAQNYANVFQSLKSHYDLSQFYFQTTFMIYDTSIIQEDTFSSLVSLAEKFPISLTNDQAIIALYYTQVKPCWEQIPIGDEEEYYYSYKFTDKKKPTIMSKWNR